MKNQKQLIKEIEKINNLFTIQQGALNFNVGEIINIVVSACEEVVIETNEGYQGEELGSVIQIDKILENLKKLKFV